MIRRAAAAAADLLYPLRCAGCGSFESVLCQACAGRMRRAAGPGHCPFCAAAWDGEGNCPRCFHMHQLEGVRASFEMAGAARRLIHALKYQHYRSAAPAMAAFMPALAADLAVDRFFAVPLHGSRVKERGFNQSSLLLGHAGWVPAPGLERVRKTQRQVGQRLGERRANVAGAFEYRGDRLDGLTVALVDDVVTTGATAVECARALKDAGARAVWAIAFARASYHPQTSEPIDD